MPDMQLSNASAAPIPLSLADQGLEAPGDAVCRRHEGQQGATGTGGAGGAGGAARAVSGGGASSAPTGASREGECLDEVLEAVGACGAIPLSDGALALIAGFGCLSNTLQAIECLAKGAGK